MQQAAIRPWTTAGVALVAAGTVAVTPVAAPLPDLVVAPSPAVELTSSIGDLLSNTAANVTDLWKHASAVPLQYYGDVLLHPGALFQQGMVPFIPDGYGTDTLYQSIEGTHLPSLNWSIDNHLELFDYLQDHSPIPIPEQFLDFLGSPLGGFLWGGISAFLSPWLQLKDDVTAIFQDIGAGDWGQAFKDLLDAPVNMVNAWLNGYGDIDIPVDSGGGLGSLFADVDSPISIHLGGLLSPGASIFDAISVSGHLIGSSLTGAFDTGDALPVGWIGSLIEMIQAAAMHLGWDGLL